MRILYGLMGLVPFSALAVTDSCVVPGSSIEIDMTRSMAKDLGIKADAITLPKMELLATAPVSKALADQYANADRTAEFSRKGKYSLSYNDYFASYFDNGAKTLLIKYTYENHAKQKNTFVASAIVNDEECSIRFNGYVTLQREF